MASADPYAAFFIRCQEYRGSYVETEVYSPKLNGIQDAILVDYLSVMRAASNEPLFMSLVEQMSGYLMDLDQNRYLEPDTRNNTYMEACITALFETYHQAGLYGLSTVQEAIDGALTTLCLHFHGPTAVFIIECLHGRIVEKTVAEEEWLRTIQLFKSLGATITMEPSYNPATPLIHDSGRTELLSHLDEAIAELALRLGESRFFSEPIFISAPRTPNPADTPTLFSTATSATPTPERPSASPTRRSTASTPASVRQNLRTFDPIENLPTFARRPGAPALDQE